MSRNITLPTLAGPRIFDLETIKIYQAIDPHGNSVPGNCCTTPYSALAGRWQVITLPVEEAEKRIIKAREG